MPKYEFGGLAVSNRTLAENFPPGDFLQEELDARCWSQAKLATLVGCSPKDIGDVVSGEAVISAEMAEGLGAALGTSAQYWLNLESSYRRWRVASRVVVLGA